MALQIEYDRNGFHWNEREQSNLLGSFFWVHWVLQLPGGILARKYGTKLIFGLSNGIGVFCCFLIPIFSYWSYSALLSLRVFQGFVTVSTLHMDDDFLSVIMLSLRDWLGHRCML